MILLLTIGFSALAVLGAILAHRESRRARQIERMGRAWDVALGLHRVGAVQVLLVIADGPEGQQAMWVWPDGSTLVHNRN